jgi:hypothetical protein
LNLDRIEIKDASSWDNSKEEEQSIYKKVEKLETQGKNTEKYRRSDIERKMNKVFIYEDVKIYDYAHRGFMKLRSMDGITSEMIQYSLDPENTKTMEQAKKAGESTGKSGSFFFFSHDRRFIMKTMFTSELDVFMENIENYF